MSGDSTSTATTSILSGSARGLGASDGVASLIGNLGDAAIGIGLSAGAGRLLSERPLICFPAGTPVHTPDGTKAIEQIAAGDRVRSYDHWQMRWVERRVVEVFRNQNRGPMATIRVGGETIRATGGHPFWVVDGEGLAERRLPERINAYEVGARQPGRWVLAIDLRAGDQILRLDGEASALDCVEVDESEEAVYNFRVFELPNYAVGACGVLVHNENQPVPNAPKDFGVDSGQLGKKLGKHTQDFGLDPSNAAHRTQISDLINDIGRNPERSVSGTFRGQGPGGARGPVEFRIKGSDVVVTTPDGEFVTLLKDGINNPSVMEALKNAGG